METAKAASAQAALDRGEILSRLRERILAYAASRLSRDLAEDLAQEVLLVLHEKYGHLHRPEDILPVSFRILRFKMVALRRRLVRRGETGRNPVEDMPLADPGLDPERNLERREMMERLSRAVEAMGERCRELFRLKLEGRSFHEIQALMGVRSINTIYTWDSRCRRRLLELMGGRWEAGQ